MMGEGGGPSPSPSLRPGPPISGQPQAGGHALRGDVLVGDVEILDPLQGLGLLGEEVPVPGEH